MVISLAPNRKNTRREAKRDKLDYLLLFTSSFLGVFFALLQPFLEKSITVLYFIPLLVLGAALPIYIGYIRGALIYESVPERVRGWMYLIMGVPFYLFFTIGRTVGLGLFTISGIPADVIIWVNFAVLVIITVTLLLLIVYRHVIVERLFDICEEKISRPAEKAIWVTSFTAFGLGIYSYLLVFTVLEKDLLSLAFYLSSSLFLLYLGESISRKILSLRLHRKLYSRK